MSALTDARKNEIEQLYPMVAGALDSLKEATRGTVAMGAQLGAFVRDAERANKEEFWRWISSLGMAKRQDVFDFARKAFLYRERHPELEDASQLVFALANGAESSGEAQPRMKTSDIAAFTSAIMALSAKAAKLKTKPVSEWDTSVKDSIREQLRPLVTLWEELK